MQNKAKRAELKVVLCVCSSYEEQAVDAIPRYVVVLLRISLSPVALLAL